MLIRNVTLYAQLAELADALDLGSSGRPWGFESLVAHHVRLHRECQKRLKTPVNGAFFVVEKSTKSKNHFSSEFLAVLKIMGILRKNSN